LGVDAMHKTSVEFKFGGRSPRRRQGAQPPKCGVLLSHDA